MEPVVRCALLPEGLEDADAGDVLLHKTRKAALLLLDPLALGVDRAGNPVDGPGHQGQRQQRKEGELHIDVQHHSDHQQDEDEQVERVHQGRTQVHPHLADVLGDSVHQVPRVMRFVESRVQPLVMVEDARLQVKLHMPGEDDDGLARKKQKHPFDEERHHVKQRLETGHPAHPAVNILAGVDVRGRSLREQAGHQVGQGRDGLVGRKDLFLRGFIAQGGKPNPFRIAQRVDAFADERRCIDCEQVGQDDEQDAAQQMPLVLPNQGVEGPEGVHQNRKFQVTEGRMGNSETWYACKSRVPLAQSPVFAK